jgi:phosphomannomutase
VVSPANQNRLSQLAASKLGARLFRANVGLAWVGEQIAKTADTITLKNPRPFRAGVVGQSDSCGWISVEITPDMVGSRVAVYLAVEDKQGAGRASVEQKAFIAAVRQAGGRAGVSRGDADVAAIIRGEIRD